MWRRHVKERLYKVTTLNKNQQNTTTDQPAWPHKDIRILEVHFEIVERDKPEELFPEIKFHRRLERLEFQCNKIFSRAGG